MATTGITSKNGKLYLNGEEIQGGSGSANNTFNKIVVFGTSIESSPAGASNCWPKYLAEILGLTYKYIGKSTDDTVKPSSGVINYAVGGGGVTWYADDVYITEDITSYKGHVLNAFSCSPAEKQDAVDYFKGQGLMDATDEANQNKNICYTNSVLENLDADLFIFGTYGINDGGFNWMKFTGEVGDNNGNWNGSDLGLEQTSYTIHDVTAFDRRTIYGAYNYVLRALYQANPNAKVVILGQHTQGTDNFTWTDNVNGVQRAVAEKWQIPFADWGTHLSLRQTWPRQTEVHVNSSSDHYKRSMYQSDNVHPLTEGNQMLAKWVAEWITETKLKNMNPRWGLGE